MPGNLLKNPFDEVSLGLGYMLGLAGLPHVMTRFYTVPEPPTTARRSVIWVMFLAGAFFACTTIFGLAAVHYLGPQALRVGNPGGNLTLPLLAQISAARKIGWRSAYARFRLGGGGCNHPCGRRRVRRWRHRARSPTTYTSILSRRAKSQSINRFWSPA